MKMAIFGASGRTGRHLTKLALAGGHQVAVLARDPRRLDSKFGVKVVVGTSVDADAIADVLDGADAALSVLGSGSGILTGFARAAIPIMERSGPARIVSLVGAGVAEPGDPSSFGRNIMLGLMKLLESDS